MPVIHNPIKSAAGLRYRHLGKTLWIWLSILGVALLASACSPATSAPSSEVISWIDAPLNGSTLPLAPYEIVAHGSAPDSVQTLEISINGEILGVVKNPNPGDLLFTAKLDWSPSAAGEYLIQARTETANGQSSALALARVEVIENYQPPISLELLPSTTPTLELVSCDPGITATMNATCRRGPSPYNVPTAYLLEGDTAAILGQNRDASWWAIQPDALEEPCWLSGTTVTASCIQGDLELLESPPYITRIFPTNLEIYWGDNPQKTTTIQAQSGGEIPVAAVRFIYHLAGKAQWYNISMTPTSEDIWHVVLDARNIAGYRDIESAVIEYYIEATNQAGLFTKSVILNNLKLKKMP
jgi:hypothetical protein